MLDNEIIRLEGEIYQHDRAYYDRHAPTITDSEYDLKIVRLRDLYAGAIPPSSVLYYPGKTLPMPGRIEKTHDRPMISLRTEVLTSQFPIDAFHQRVLEVTPEPEYVAECKYDGLAVSLRVVKGRIHSAVLRGDGEKGEDVWDNVRYINNIHTYLSDTSIEEIRGEIVMFKSKLETCNKYRRDLNKDPYVNTRNAAAGMVRTLQVGSDLWSNALPALISESLLFIPYSVFRKAGSPMTTQSEDLEFLWREFGVMDHLPSVIVSKEPAQLYSLYKTIEEQRQKLPFEIDGAVYKVNDVATQRKLGVTGREPNWAIAHKYKAEEVETKLLSIDTQVGPSGRLTPVARLQPVFVGGTTITNVTLSNVFQIRKKGIRIGDTVIVRRAGDVIPEIVGPSADNVRQMYVPNFRLRHECPECKTEFRRAKGMVNSDCPNWNCPAQVKGRLTDAFSRDCLDVDGIGPGVIEALVDYLGVSTVPEILDLTEDDLYRAGLGDSTSVSLAAALADLRETPIPIDRAIRAFGIPKVGNSASRKLAPYISGWNNGEIDFHLDKVSLNEDVVANIHDAVKKFQVEMCGIMERLSTVQPPVESEGKLKGKSFAMTGGHATLSRTELADIITRNGGKVTGAPNKATTAYLVGSGASPAKVDKAKRLGVEIIDVNTFINSL